MKNLKLLALSLLISACSHIEIKDIPVYWDAGPDGAVSAYTLSDKTSVVDKASWDAQRMGYACISADDFGWFKASLEKACSQLGGMCKKEDKAKLVAFFERSEKARKRKHDKR